MIQNRVFKEDTEGGVAQRAPSPPSAQETGQGQGSLSSKSEKEREAELARRRAFHEAMVNKQKTDKQKADNIEFQPLTGLEDMNRDLTLTVEMRVSEGSRPQYTSLRHSDVEDLKSLMDGNLLLG